MGLVFIYVNAYIYFMRELALFYAALSDETRLRLLCLMRGREVCVCHLQGVLGTNQPKISRHLAYLRNAGIVSARREGKCGAALRGGASEDRKLAEGLRVGPVYVLDNQQQRPTAGGSID